MNKKAGKDIFHEVNKLPKQDDKNGKFIPVSKSKDYSLPEKHKLNTNKKRKTDEIENYFHPGSELINNLVNIKSITTLTDNLIPGLSFETFTGDQDSYDGVDSVRRVSDENGSLQDYIDHLPVISCLIRKNNFDIVVFNEVFAEFFKIKKKKNELINLNQLGIETSNFHLKKNKFKQIIHIDNDKYYIKINFNKFQFDSDLILCLINYDSYSLQPSENQQNETDVYFIIDIKTGKVSYSDNSIQKMTGYQLSDINNIEEILEKIIPEENRELLKGKYNKLLIGLIEPFYEIKIKSSEGKEKWINIKCILQKDESENLIAIKGIAKDVTDDKAEINKIANIENRLNHIINIVPHMIYIKNRAGKVLLANKAVGEIFGRDAESIIGKSLYDLSLNNTDAEKFNAQDRSVIDSGNPLYIDEEKYINPKGEDAYLQTIKIPFFDQGIGETVILGVSVDITNYKKIEQELRDKEKIVQKKLKTLTEPKPFSKIPDFNFTDVFEIDEIQVIQDSFSQTAGVSSIILTPEGKPITKPSNFVFTKDEYLNFFKSGTDSYFYEKKSETGSVEIQKCGDDIFWEGVAKVKIGENHIGNWVIGQVVDVDVSEKELEEKYFSVFKENTISEKNLNRMDKNSFLNVAHTLNNITNQLSKVSYQNILQARYILEREKFQAEKIGLNKNLIEKNRELEQLISILSHDLRTPLINVEGFSKELEIIIKESYNKIVKENISDQLKTEIQTSHNADVLTSLKYIDNAVKKMDSMLTGIQRFADIGKYNLNEKNIDIDNLITQVINSFSVKIKENKIEFNVNHLPDCWGDEKTLYTVFYNVIDNAIKFLHTERSGKITVKGNSNKKFANYIIEDNGIGFEEKFQDKIFDIFFQINPAETRGVGIGLAISRKIMLKNNGKIWAESNPGIGSKIFISIPLKNQGISSC